MYYTSAGEAFVAHFYIYMYVLTRTHTHTRVLTHTHSHMHLRTHIHTRMHTHTHTHMHICTHTRTHAHAHTHSHMHLHVCTHIHIHIHVCMHTHTRIHTHACTHTCTYAHTHTRSTDGGDQHRTVRLPPEHAHLRNLRHTLRCAEHHHPGRQDLGGTTPHLLHRGVEPAGAGGVHHLCHQHPPESVRPGQCCVVDEVRLRPSAGLLFATWSEVSWGKAWERGNV